MNGWDFDLDEMRESCQYLGETKLSFGCSYLDDACSGILKNDLIILSAGSGIGKTQLASLIAYSNAIENNKKVYFFALEAFKNEIQLRLIYNLAMNQFYKDKKQSGKYLNWCYQFSDYVERKFNPQVEKYILDAEEHVRVASKNLKIKYRKKDFSIKTFESDIEKISTDADLIIVDHLQYFDYGDQKENVAITNIVKKIRDLNLLTEIPTILISHINNSYSNFNQIVPSQKDLHGSSNIYKTASKVIFIAPHYQEDNSDSTIVPTIFRVAKARGNGGVQKYIGLCPFNLSTQSYEKKYSLGYLNFNETEFRYIDKNFPLWSKNHV